jgi:oligopeptide/dipeptide ABC transporter ATP-binding protein
VSTAASTNGAPLLEVRDLVKWFPVRRGFLQGHAGDVKAVDGISFDVQTGETVSLVGESGCGKTTAARALLRLIEPTSGKALYHPADGRAPVDLFALSGAELRRWRRDLQIVFQDPYESLNPRMSVGEIVGEAMRVHGLARGSELDERVAALLERVGLEADMRNRFPHEFSGGQRQRIGIARALALDPRFVVCDEAVSALDVSVQAQILNLLQDLREELGLSYLFIAHDLSVVRHVSDRIAVMYLGRIVETGTVEDVFERPAHPYTRALLEAVPSPDPKRKKARADLGGEVPSPLDPPGGCHFRTRCPLAEERCREAYPRSESLGETHTAACHLLESPPPTDRPRDNQAAPPASDPGGRDGPGPAPPEDSP